MSLFSSTPAIAFASENRRRVLEQMSQTYSWGLRNITVRSISERVSQLVRQQQQHHGEELRQEISAAKLMTEGDGDDDELCQKLDIQQKLQEHGSLPYWGRIPEDVCLNLFGFLSAPDLCAVRAASWDLHESADLHADVLWKHLCKYDFPSVYAQDQDSDRPSHQLYIKNVQRRASQEAGNLRSTQRIRESLQNYSSSSSATNGGGGEGWGGFVGLFSDLGFISDPRIARAVSHKRRAAMSSAVVASERVVYDFRCRGLYSGPLNFLPLSTLLLEDAATASAVGVPIGLGMAGVGGGGGGGGGRLLPPAPEMPAPRGFLGYAVRLVRLRPEHEALRWTVLFAVFKDMAVFETGEQAEAVRSRMPQQRLFYCALDHRGAQDDPCPSRAGGGGAPLPHIGHWGFRPLLDDGTAGFVGSEGKARGDGGGAGVREKMVEVGVMVEKMEKKSVNARSSLAFLQYGGVARRPLQQPPLPPSTQQQQQQQQQALVS